MVNENPRLFWCQKECFSLNDDPIGHYSCMFLVWVSNFSSRWDNETDFCSLQVQVFYFDAVVFVLILVNHWIFSLFFLSFPWQRAYNIRVWSSYARLNLWCLVQMPYVAQKIVKRMSSVILAKSSGLVERSSCIRWFGRIPSAPASLSCWFTEASNSRSLGLRTYVFIIWVSFSGTKVWS